MTLKTDVPHMLRVFTSVQCSISRWLPIVPFRDKPNQTKNTSAHLTQFAVTTLANSSLEWLRLVRNNTHGFTLCEVPRYKQLVHFPCGVSLLRQWFLATRIISWTIACGVSLLRQWFLATRIISWTIATCWYGVDSRNNAIGWKSKRAMKR